MPVFVEQQKNYQLLWERYSPLFGTEVFQDDPIPNYNIGISLPPALHGEMGNLSESLQKTTNAVGGWITPNRMHITMDIPGRIGKHFTETDVPLMQEWLVDICSATKSFTVLLGDLNCFPNVLYREVYDQEEKLYALHEKMTRTIPWSEQPQFRGKNFTPHMSLLYLKQVGVHLFREGFSRSIPQAELLVSQIYFQVSTDTADNPIALIGLGSGKLLQ